MTRRLSPGLLCLLFLVASAQPGLAQSNGIKYFKSYFYTGSQIATGVPLKAITDGAYATGNLVINGVPAEADVLAAYVYWMTVTSRSGNGASGAAFNGADISLITKNLNPNGTAPCWSAGGATGDGGEARVVKTYRADVMPFLPVGADGRRTANGTHVIKVPNMGTGNAVPSVAGASLLVLYRLPNAPLTATVIYDGGFTMNQANPKLMLPFEGWYQSLAGAGIPQASLIQFAANGQSNFTELMTLKDGNGNTIGTPIANPFTGTLYPGTTDFGPWDTRVDSFPLPADSKAASVTVERGATTGSFDCLSWGAFALSVPVRDSDKDGIIDRLEEQTTSGTLKNPRGELLPDLYAMGARSNIRDIFMEIGYLKSSKTYTNALNQTIQAGHSHLPKLEALSMVARAFRDQNINVHFDVGDNYQDAALLPVGGWSSCPTATATDWKPGCAVIRKANAEGGDAIEELPCDVASKACTFTEYKAPLPCAFNTGCQFDGVPGTVGWKSGYQSYRDEPLTHRRTKKYVVGNKEYFQDIGPDEVACSIAETDTNADGTPNSSTVCQRRLSGTRLGLFRYSLWVHALGIPKSENPQDAGYHLPRNTSGMADYLGGDLSVALGLWDGATGSTFMQASTLMHELGHTLGRRHGGPTGELNCKPNYQSVMNYLFQVGGLLDASGIPRIDYSSQVLPSPAVGLNESNLSEQSGIGPSKWRTRWYAPWNATTNFVVKNLNVSFATKRCNGAPQPGELMVRVDGDTASAPIDWNVDGDLVDTIAQDVNFSGSDESLAGATDWDQLNLQQVGSRRNVGGWSVNSGYWDSGYWDAGANAESASGYWDSGYWDSGYWDSGYWDAGYWDSGYWDSGYWDSGVENEAPVGEVDLDNAEAAAVGPNSVSAAISGKNVLIKWAVPVLGSDKVDHYEVYRIEGTAINATTLATKVPISVTIPATTTQVLDTTAKNNVPYIYIALAQFTDSRRSGFAAAPVFVK